MRSSWKLATEPQGDCERSLRDLRTLDFEREVEGVLRSLTELMLLTSPDLSIHKEPSGDMGMGSVEFGGASS